MKSLIAFNEIPKTLQEALTWRGDIQTMKNTIDYHAKKMTEDYLIIGLFLCVIEKNGTWKSDGSCAKNFNSWVTNEMHISKSSAQRMMQVYKTFSKYLESFSDLILNVDFSKLALIAPVVARMDNDDDIIEMIHSCEGNSFRALDANIKESEGKIPFDMCPGHIWKTKTIDKCTICGQVIVKGE